MYGTFLCQYPVYANNWYAINWTIFFTCEWLWFGILESYAIKWFMRLIGMQRAEAVCTNISYTGSQDVKESTTAFTLINLD